LQSGYQLFLWALVLVDLGGAAAAPTLRLTLAAALAFCRRSLRGSIGVTLLGGVALRALISAIKLGIDHRLNYFFQENIPSGSGLQSLRI